MLQDAWQCREADYHDTCGKLGRTAKHQLEVESRSSGKRETNTHSNINGWLYDWSRFADNLKRWTNPIILKTGALFHKVGLGGIQIEEDIAATLT